MKKIIVLTAIILLISTTISADDVIIDSSGNMTTGTSTTNGNLEVIGSSGEDGIVGSTSGTDAAGVYGVNTTNGNYGILGYDTYGVYGNSSGWAGYFEGNARVTGNLTVDGTVTGYTEIDPLFSAWDKSTGILIIESQISDLDHFTTSDETDPTVNALGKATLSCLNDQIAKWDGSAWLCANDNSDESSYGMVTVVAKSGGNYLSPVTAMSDIATWCGTPEPTNPCLMRIMPGVYNIDANYLQMQEYVDIEGSGENVTRITGNRDSWPGVVHGSDNAEIRFITVENTGGGAYAWGISAYNTSPKFTHLTVITSGANENASIGCVDNASAIITNVTAIASGGIAAIGMYIENASPTLNNVRTTGSDGTLSLGIDMNLSASPIMTNVTAIASGGEKTHGLHINGASSPTISDINIIASGATNENYALYIISASSPEINNMTANASGTNSRGVYTKNYEATTGGTVKIDHSVIKGSTIAIYTDTTFTVLVGNTRIGGFVTGPGTFKCAGVYDSSYTFYPGPICP